MSEVLEDWYFIEESKPFKDVKRQGKYLLFGESVRRTYSRTGHPEILKHVDIMVNPQQLKAYNRSKYMPHQGKQEMERRKTRMKNE